jgi:hypothetical protein
MLPRSFTRNRIFIAALTLLLAPPIVDAQSTAFTYQGRLSDGGSSATGSYDIQFKVYDALTDGAQLGAVTNPTVQVTAGAFTVELDFGAGVFDGAARFLEICVRPAGSADPYAVLAPRQKVTSTPYATRSASAAAADTATNAIQLGGLPSSNFVQFAVNGNVGIGTTNPFSKLTVQTNPESYGIEHTDGTISLDTFLGGGNGAWLGTRSNHPLYFYTNNTFRMALATSGNIGIGTSAPKHLLTIVGGFNAPPPWTSNLWGGAVELANATAIGWRSNAGGQRFGIGQTTDGLYFFRTASDPGTTGSPANYSLLLSDIGSVIVAPGATPPTAGVAFEVNGVARVAPGNGGAIGFGAPNAETGITINNVIGSTRADVRFDGQVLRLVAAGPGGPPPSTNGISITTAGNVTIASATPTQIGGWLHVNGGDFTGVYGNSNVYGVRGEATGNLGVGVRGISTASNGYGLYGSSSGNLGFGVYAQGNRYAGYFDGNVNITGTLSGPTSSVKIDHPLDPANKYLNHSIVESPDMMTIYNGIAIMSDGGEVVVRLPDWFDALNKDFRYQLTAIGAPGPNLYIAEEVSSNRFKIAGGTPGMKVSWQVTGIRQDAFANANRTLIEEKKPEEERGYYLHPELFNQPEEKSIEWARNPEMMRMNKEEREKTKKEKLVKP